MARIVLRAEAREGSTYQVTVNFLDANGVALTPETATWTLMKGDGTVVNSRTTVTIVTPSSEETITLTAADVTCTDTTPFEYRVLRIDATYDSGKPLVDEIWFPVRNLVGA
jgi:hypothetical protein